MKSIVMIIDYFGAWPEWFPLFMACCKANPTMAWHFHTDCPIPDNPPTNLTFFPITFEDYKTRVSHLLDMEFRPKSPYKVCDLKPAYGFLYPDEIKNFDYWGFGDIDLVYGDIRKFYTDDVLTHNVISTHHHITAGHMTLIKNEPWLTTAFQKVPGWKDWLIRSQHQRFDELHFVEVFKSEMAPRHYRENNYFKEQYTTIMSNCAWHNNTLEYPDVWYWQNNRVTNNQDGDREFIYYHFMNYKHLWKRLPTTMHLSPEEIDQGVRIDKAGIHALNGRDPISSRTS